MADGLDDASIVNAIDLKAAPDEKVKQLEKLSEENDPIVTKFLEEVDSKYGTESKTSKKLAHKILEKSQRPSILERKPWFKVEHIRDSFRFKTVLKDIGDLPKIAQDLKDSEMCEVVKVDTGKVLNPDYWGWRIVAFDLKMKNGQLVEYYLAVKELEQAKKEGNHELFERWRNEDPKKLTPEQKEERLKDIDTSFDKYDQGWKTYLDRTKQKPGKVKEILDRTEKILKEPIKTKEQKEPLKKVDYH